MTYAFIYLSNGIERDNLDEKFFFWSMLVTFVGMDILLLRCLYYNIF